MLAYARYILLLLGICLIENNLYLFIFLNYLNSGLELWIRDEILFGWYLGYQQHIIYLR